MGEEQKEVRACSSCERLKSCALWRLLEEVWSRWHTTVTPVDMKVVRCDGVIAEATMWERGVGPETRYIVFWYCLRCERVVKVTIRNLSDVIFPYAVEECEHAKAELRER